MNESDHKMQILMLTTSFPVDEGSSSGIFVERLAQRLCKENFLQVIAPATDTSSQYTRSTPYRLHTFNYAPKKWQVLAHKGGGIPVTLSANPWTLFLLPSFLISMFIECLGFARRAEIIFANWSICGVIAGIVGFLVNKPVVTTLRGEDVNRALHSSVYRFLIRICCQSNRRIVTVSDDIAKNLAELFPVMANKIVMIPNGVDLLIEKLPAISKKKGDCIQLLMIGSLIPRKSIDTALNAMALLPDHFTLTLIGDGPEKERLVSIVSELELGKRVRFIGHVYPENIASWLGSSDVLLMTSKTEGRPNAVLEALAAGLPVIGSDIPGIRELILPGINGDLFPCENHKLLAARILPLANPELRSRLGEGARNYVVEKELTWENTANRYLAVFKEVSNRGIY